MKKQFGFPLMLASALAFSACSSDDVADKGSKDISALTDGGYLKMSINLPSRAANGGFRAAEDQNGYVSLTDGLAKEYNVKDAILVLFQGKTGKEGEAVFHSAYKLTTSMQMDGTQQITSTTKLVQKVNKGGEANKLDADYNTLYALVILNNNGRFAVDDNKLMYVSSNLATATSTGATPTPVPTPAPAQTPTTTKSFTGTFSDFQKITVTGGAASFCDDTKGFLMMNAPLYKTASTASTSPSDLATLAVVTDKVKNTETAAQNEPGAEVFVERAVAKVTMAPYTSGQLTGAEYPLATNKVDVKLVAWGLDYMNNISYYMHNAKPVTTGIRDWAGFNVNGDAASSNYYRFAGDTEVKAGYGYRAYWGEDPNYNAESETNSEGHSVNLWGSVSKYPGEKCNFIHVTNINDLSDETGENYPQYCMENTFNVKNMNEDQTTRAIVKVKLEPQTKDANGTFYIVNNDKSKFFNTTGIESLVETHIKACNTVTTEALTSGAPVVSNIVLEPVAAGSPNLKVTSFKVTYGSATAPVTYVETAGDDAVDEVNNALSTVTKYDKGYAYYPIRIKHFGSSKTLSAGGYDAGMVTWNSAIHSQTDRYNNNSDEKFLGRYGVLRNNWYDLGINSISGVGSPVIPDAPGTPDDELESFISVRINVLSWAKRIQREDL